MRVLSGIAAVASVLCVATMVAPTSVSGQLFDCGWCETCILPEELRVAGNPYCQECHRDKSWNEWTQECDEVESCANLEECSGGEEEDADFEEIELLARDLKSDDPGVVMAALDVYGSRLTLSKERRGIMLFGGCSRDLILAFVPVSNSTLNLAAGLKTTEAYLADLLTDL